MFGIKKRNLDNVTIELPRRNYPVVFGDTFTEAMQDEGNGYVDSSLALFTQSRLECEAVEGLGLAGMKTALLYANEGAIRANRTLGNPKR